MTDTASRMTARAFSSFLESFLPEYKVIKLQSEQLGSDPPFLTVTLCSKSSSFQVPPDTPKIMTTTTASAWMCERMKKAQGREVSNGWREGLNSIFEGSLNQASNRQRLCEEGARRRFVDLMSCLRSGVAEDEEIRVESRSRSKVEIAHTAENEYETTIEGTENYNCMEIELKFVIPKGVTLARFA